MTSLAFSSNDYQLLATAAEDNKVKIWNAYTKECLFCMTNLEKLVSLDWQIGSNSVVYIGSEKLGLFIWETNKKSLVTLKTNEKNSVLIIKSSPYVSNWIAVGYKGGLIAIVNTTKSHIVKKFRGHDDDIISLAWSFCSKEEDCAFVGCLASTSRDKTFRVWDVEKERMEYNFTIPQIHKAGYFDESNRNRHWSSVIWYPNSNQLLLLTTFSGDLLIWDLKKKGKKKWETFKHEENDGHNKCIFNALILKPEENIVCTISLDRQIVFWNLNEKTFLCSMPTIGGFCYALEICPQDVSQLAVGSGDGVIRILNMAKSHFQSTATFWQGIKGKVTNISWHPDKEGLIAFGTDEGRVGIIDTLNNKPPMIFKSFHKESVYKVGWGPESKYFKEKDEVDVKLKLNLYSCGDFIIYIHNPSDLNSHAINFDDITNSTNQSYKPLLRTDFAWKSDFSVIAVGNSEGTVEIFSGRNLQLLVQIIMQKKLINCLQWHPSFTVISNSSPLHAWLASASNDSAIYIYDLFPYLDNPEKEVKEVSTLTESVHQLSGHQARVVSLSWSPHFPGRLISASYDNTVQVWNVLEGKPFANYRGHKGRVYSVTWSFLSPDDCFSGGEDYCIHKWNSSKLEHTVPPTKQFIKNNRKMKREQVLPKLNEEDNKLVQEMIERKIEQLKLQQEKANVTDNVLKTDIISQKNSNILEQEDSYEEDENSDLEDDLLLNDNCSVSSSSALTKKSSSKRKSGKGKKTQKSLFPYSASLENRGKKFNNDDCIFLTNLLTEEKNEDSETSELQAGLDDTIHLGLFLDRSATWRMLNSEINHHKKSKNFEYAMQLEIWKGNIGNALREAADKNMLNDYLVSLAPLGSRELWLEMANKYAEQLIASGAIQKSVLYLLACHKVYKAIDTLRDHGFYKEALVLAKVRLPLTDPIIETILKEWAFKAKKNNNHTIAAKCYLGLQDYSQASKQLASIPDPITMKTAAYISKKCGHTNESQSYMISCIKLSLKKQEWDLAYSLISQHPEIQYLALVVTTHKLIYKHFEILHSLDHIGWINPFHCNNDTEEALIWKGATFDDKSFLSIIKNCWIAENLLKENEEEPKIINYHQFIESLIISQYASSVKEYYIMLAIELCSLLLISWNKDISNGSIKVTILRQLNRLFSLSETNSTLNTICLLLFPEEIKWSLSNGIQISPPSEENIFMVTALHDNLEDLIEDKIDHHHMLCNEEITIDKTDTTNQTYKKTESFIVGYFMFSFLNSLENSIKNFVGFKCELCNETDEIHQECIPMVKLFMDIILKIKTSLLIDTHAQYNRNNKELNALNLKIAVINSDKLYKSYDDEYSKKKCESIELQTENGTSTNEEFFDEYSRLKKEQDVILQECQSLEKLTYGYSFPDPVLSAKKIKTICEEFISACSCSSVCKIINTYVDNINTWIKRFDIS